MAGWHGAPAACAATPRTAASARERGAGRGTAAQSISELLSEPTGWCAARPRATHPPAPELDRQLPSLQCGGNRGGSSGGGGGSSSRGGSGNPSPSLQRRSRASSWPRWCRLLVRLPHIFHSPMTQSPPARRNTGGQGAGRSGGGWLTGGWQEQPGPATSMAALRRGSLQQRLPTHLHIPARPPFFILQQEGTA